MGKEDEQTSTTTSTSAPPDFILNEIKNALGMSREALESGGSKEFYPGSTVVPFSDDTIASMDSLRSMVGSGPNDSLAAGLDTLKGVLGSGATDPEALRAAAQGSIDDVLSRTNTQFGRAGRSGSGLATMAAADGITGALGDEQARIRQQELQALGLVPGYNAMEEDERFRDSKILAGLGSAIEGKDREALMEDIARFNFGQNQGDVNLNEYIGRIQGLAGLAGGTTTGESTQVTEESPWGDIIGLGTSLALAPATGGGSLFGNLFI